MKTKPLGPITETARGFEIVKFNDASGVGCSLQQSSLAIYQKPGTSAIWLGCDDANPRKFIPGQGWTDVKVPDDVLINTRAHLNREQVAALIAHLQAWLDTDSFKITK